MNTAILLAAAAQTSSSSATMTGTILGVLFICFLAAVIMRTGIRILKFIIRSLPLVLLAGLFGFIIYF